MKQRGQSLVEMAIITPILILIFIGLLAIGFAMRRYSVNLNYSRELARTAIREARYGGLDLGGQTADEVGYQRLDAHFAEISKDDPLEDGANLSVDMAIVSVFPGRPCATDPCPGNCDALSPADIYPDDDRIVTPDDRPEFYHHIGAERDRIEWTDRATAMLRASTISECRRQKRDNELWSPDWDDSIVVVTRYDYVFFWSFPIQNETVMRFSRVARQTP